MNQKMIKQIMISCLGLFLRGLGVGLMLYAGLGSNPATVFQIGFSLSLSKDALWNRCSTY